MGEGCVWEAWKRGGGILNCAFTIVLLNFPGSVPDYFASTMIWARISNFPGSICRRTSALAWTFCPARPAYVEESGWGAGGLVWDVQGGHA